MDDLLQQGITAFKAGKRDEARNIFIMVVKQSPDSERAWGWMSNVCNTDQERVHCLEQVVRINPKNEKAHQLLDQILAPPFTFKAPLSSVPSITPTPSRSGVTVVSKNPGFTRAQLFVLLGLAVLSISIFGASILYMFAPKDTLTVAASPTNIVTSSANLIAAPTQVLPTATLIPTYAYLPTFTPLPSPTSFVIATLVPPTSKPQQVQDNPAPVNPPSVNSASDCSAELEYAAAMHHYYLDSVDYIHSTMIDYYRYLIDEATGNRDAVGLVKAQRGLDNEKAQVQAEKVAENKRYEAEKAHINATC